MATKLTPREEARLTHVSERTIRYIEKGERKPSINLAIEMLKIRGETEIALKLMEMFHIG